MTPVSPRPRSRSAASSRHRDRTRPSSRRRASGSTPASAPRTSKGGVGGRQLTLVSADDGDGELANLNAARHLVVDDKAFGLIEVSTSGDGGAKFLADEGVPVTGWGITSAWGTYRNMFGYRYSTSPKPEGEPVTRTAQFIKDHGGQRVAIVAGGAAASVNVANQVGETLPALGMTLGYKTTEVALGDNDFAVQVQRMIDAKVDSLYTGMAATQNVTLYKAAAKAGLHFKVALFPTGYDDRFAAAFGADLEGAYVAIDWRPYELPVPAHDEFKQNLAAVAPDEFPSQLAMVGWLSADAFIRGLVEAGASCPTRKAFIANLRLVKDYDADGLLPPTDFGAVFGKMPLCFYYLQLHDSHFVPVGDKPFCGVLLKDYPVRVARLRPQSLAVLVSLAIVAFVFAAIARQVVGDDGRRLLQKQAAEVSALLTNSFSGVDASLRSLTSVADPTDPSARAFVQSAEPLVVGQTRAIILARVEATAVRRVALVGDGVPEGELTGSRADLVRRATREPGLVTGVISDGPRRRIGLARGPWPNREGWVVYQESAIDPNNRDQPTTGRPFRELDVAVYATKSPEPDQLVLATTREVPLRGTVATVTVHVGVDQWLVVAHSPRPLVGAFASFVPWLLLIVGLATALLACAVVEVVSRRRDFAVALVDERTAVLQSTVSELESAQAELVRHAFSDDLTGLANRSLFLNRLENSLARAVRGTLPSVVMFLDLDRFKWVNDSLGHEVGDQLLVAVAQRLAEAVRPGDTIARLGGDEFVVLCEGPGR